MKIRNRIAIGVSFFSVALLSVATSVHSEGEKKSLDDIINIFHKNGISLGQSTHRVTENEPPLTKSPFQIRVLSTTWCGPCKLLDAELKGYREGMKANGQTHQDLQYELGANHNHRVPVEVFKLDRMEQDTLEKAEKLQICEGIPEIQLVNTETKDIVDVACGYGWQGLKIPLNMARNAHEITKRGDTLKVLKAGKDLPELTQTLVTPDTPSPSETVAPAETAPAAPEVKTGE